MIFFCIFREDKLFISMKHIGDMLISESISPDKNYAKVENGKVVVVLNEYTKRHGYMPISEAKEFAHSILDAIYKKEEMILENGNNHNGCNK